jgi:competence protein ComEA
MIWDVKICLAKIKDGKGKDLLFSNKKKFPTKIPPKYVEKPISGLQQRDSLTQIYRMSWKQLAADYFTFTRKERVAILVLVALILLVFLAPVVFSGKMNQKISHKPDTAWVAAVKKMEVKQADEKNEAFDGKSDGRDHVSWRYSRSGNSYPNTTKRELFYFDPNTLRAEGWKQLGLRDKTITTIQNYLSKGGHFYKPEDLSGVYGLFEDEYARLEPYIRIEKKEPGRAGFSQNEKIAPVVKTERYKTIDINAADTSAFIALPGIGSKLAVRIVNFRNKLGGFYSIVQIGETFGLPDSTFQKIKQYLKLDNVAVKKININIATLDELKVHPYIRWSMANSIIAYRNEHGPFLKVEDIRKVMTVTEDIYNKLSPYLTEQ